MTNLRKAAEMALEALEEINKLSVGEKAICLPAEIDDAMEALRQALSNEFNPDWNQVEALQESLREHMAEIQRLRQALAQPEQKREWVGLTDEEYDELMLSGDWGGSLIQATEAKLKEKNT